MVNNDAVIRENVKVKIKCYNFIVNFLYRLAYGTEEKEIGLKFYLVWGISLSKQ